jgi:hypothetical protein
MVQSVEKWRLKMEKLMRMLLVGAGAFFVVFFMKKILVKKVDDREAMVDRIRTSGAF